jgi:hypothetical protein
MAEHKELTLWIGRREFTRQAVVAILSAATITIVDCGGGSSPAPAPSPQPGGGGGGAGQGDVAGAISGNHGHVAVVTGVQITAGNAVSLDIRGTASHPHTVNLTAADVGNIGQQRRVSTTSSTDDGHMHTVTFN